MSQHNARETYVSELIPWLENERLFAISNGFTVNGFIDPKRILNGDEFGIVLLPKSARKQVCAKNKCQIFTGLTTRSSRHRFCTIFSWIPASDLIPNLIPTIGDIGNH